MVKALLISNSITLAVVAGLCVLLVNSPEESNERILSRHTQSYFIGCTDGLMAVGVDRPMTVTICDIGREAHSKEIEQILELGK